MNKQPTAILVTGMHRSGTSATAGALCAAGVELGDNLLPPGSDNPKGYFESERAVAINERLLARLGSRWDDVRGLPADWEKGEEARDALRDIVALIDAQFARTSLWALKDPRICRLMPVWLDALRSRDISATSLFVVRHPVQVAASIQARNGWDPALGELLWLRYMLEAEASTRGVPRTAIAYDALLEDPGSSLGTAAARLGIKLPKQKTDTLQTFVDPSQKHQRQRRKPVNVDSFAAIATQVHAALASIAKGGDDWAPIAAAHEAFAREWTRVGSRIDAVAGMAAALDSAVSTAMRTAASASSELHAQMAWARAAVEKHEASAAEIAHLKGELSAQVAWSEAAVREREALQAENARLHSELSAQVAWAEGAVKKHDDQLQEVNRVREELQANLARSRSDLLAQVAWAEGAVEERESLQADLATTRSDLAAQLAWSERAVKDREALQEQVATLRSELAAQVAWSERAVQEREALQAQVSQLRSDLVAQVEFSEATLQQRDASRMGAAALQSRIAELERELADMRATLTWRGTRPLRVLAESFSKKSKGNRLT